MSLEKAHNRSVEQALNDKKVRGVVLQITMLLIGLFGFYWLINNTLTNLDAQGKSLGFNFFKPLLVFKLAKRLVLGCLIMRLANQHIGKFIL